MNSTNTTEFTVKELSKTAGISINALHRRCKRAINKNGSLFLPGIGYFAITKPGKSYRLLKLNKGMSKEELNKEFEEFAELLKDRVCETCRKQVIEKVLKHVRG